MGMISLWKSTPEAVVAEGDLGLLDAPVFAEAWGVPLGIRLALADSIR